MSEIKHIKGKLKLVKPPQGKTLQDFAEQYLIEKNYTISDYNRKYHNGNYVFMLADAFNDDFIIINNILFRVESSELDPDDEILNFTYNSSDDSYDFECKFYNGGTCLPEMLEEGYKRIHNNI